MVTARELTPMAMVVALSLNACSTVANLGAKSWPLSASVPAASGEVLTRKWEGKNRAVEVRVRSLAPPTQIVPGATTYVVWFTPVQENGPAQNMGALTLNSDLSGTLVVETPFVDFDVLVTAESSAGVTQPTGKEVMRAQVRGPSPTS